MQLRENAASDVHVENSAADVCVQHVECVMVKCDDGNEHIDNDESGLSSDGTHTEESTDSTVVQPTDSHLADDTVQSQHVNIADSNLPADNSNAVQAQSNEAVDGDVSQPSDSQLGDGCGHLHQHDDASSDNSQQTTTLPLQLADEPSTADSNDDAAEFVEASSSLNPECAEDLSADLHQMTDVETQQQETVCDTQQQQQQLEEEDVDDKDDDQFVDSTSDVSPP